MDINSVVSSSEIQVRLANLHYIFICFPDSCSILLPPSFKPLFSTHFTDNKSQDVYHCFFIIYTQWKPSRPDTIGKFISVEMCFFQGSIKCY